MKAHVFIDGTNIYCGAAEAAKRYEPKAPWKSIRVHFAHLFHLVEGGFEPGTRVIAGSVREGADVAWDFARKEGYEVLLLKRVEDEAGTMREQGVDELLHLRILEALMDNPPGALVLATGDGNQGSYGTSFVKQVERALRMGWHVDIWAWDLHLSENLRTLQVPPGASRTVHLLDPFYWSVAFSRGGTYDGERFPQRNAMSPEASQKCYQTWQRRRRET